MRLLSTIQIKTITRWFVCGISLLFYSTFSFAHGIIAKDQNIWTAWVYTPIITIPLIVVVLIYAAGILHRSQLGKPIQSFRAIVFLLGMAFFYIALQSPLEPLSDHYFINHQIEHLILRMFGPWLLILSMPMNVLIQGLPAWARRGFLKPIIKNRAVYKVYRLFTQPYLATFLFIATLYIWQIPVLHEQAIVNQWLHDVMHFSMILSAFFFWWVISDPRRSAARCSYGIRLFLLWAVTTFNSILGAIITMTRTLIYQVYDQGINAISMSAMEDQQYGGVILWVPGGMMGVLGTAVVFYLWVRDSRHAKRIRTKHDTGINSK